MRNSMKLIPVLLLGSTLGACSMAGTNDYYAGEYAQMQEQQLPHIYGPSAGCAYTGCAAQSSYPVAQQNYGHAPQTPNQHAYGQSVQGHPGYGVPAYAAPTHHAKHGLRGPKKSYTYGSLGATMYDVDSDLFGAQARLGWQSASFFGAEVEGSLGLTDDESFEDFGAGPVLATSEIDNQIAAFGVARLPVSPQFNVLGRVGYHNTELSAEADLAGTTVESEFSTDGIAYGVGAEYAFTPKTSIRADYTRYDFDGPDADAVSLAIARKF